MKNKKDSSANTFLSTFRDRSMAVMEDGNKVGAAYLAFLCGCWAHYFRVDFQNPFMDQNYNWFRCGYDASDDAVKMNEQLREIWKKKDERDALVKKEQK